MKAKTKFTKMYFKLPPDARTELIFDAYGKNPMTLAICMLEVRYETELGKRILRELGYEDDEAKK